MGSEDNGLPKPIAESCQLHVALPCVVGRHPSYNVAMAGSIIMYDRMAPEEPTSAPVTISRSLPSMKPVADAAQPE